jgi:hypothetical protein
MFQGRSSFPRVIFWGLIDLAEEIQGPDPENQFANQLLFGYTAHGGVAGVYRYASVVTQYKNPGLRHLIGKFNVALA